MSLKDVEKYLEEQLMQLKLNGLAEMRKTERRFREEKEEMEENHRKEMSRLSLKELEKQYEMMEFERKMRMTKSNEEMEMERIREKQKKQEKELRAANLRDLQDAVRESARMRRDEDGELCRNITNMMGMDEANNNQKQVAQFGTQVLGVQTKWTELKDFYEEQVRPQLDEYKGNDKEGILEDLANLVKMKVALNKNVLSVQCSLGKIKTLVSDDSYNAQSDALSAVVNQRFEDKELVNLRRSIKSSGTASTENVDDAIGKFNETINGLSVHPLQLKNSFAQLT
ncbi:unnamed protein product [Caenorhabditis sp. 36 PRJEB53466]|nr:unnamed protein product [Caenorhabditis sp. 36 PRJEB53466]